MTQIFVKIACIAACAICFEFGLIQAMAQQEQVAPLRIALKAGAAVEQETNCYGVNDAANEGAKSYLSFLNSRFDQGIEICPVSSFKNAAKLAKEGEVDIAWVDRESFKSISDDWRPFLSPLEHGQITRAAIVILRRKSDDTFNLKEVDTTKIGFLGIQPEHLYVDSALQVFSQNELDVSQPEKGQLYRGTKSLFAALRSKEIDLVALDITSWGRECEVLDPSKNPCSDFDLVLKEKAFLEDGLVVREDLSKALFYRLVSVHISLPFEAPKGLQWMSNGRAKDGFETVENAGFGL